LVYRLRAAIGRVNADTVPWLYGATPETLLFVGYAYSQKYTLRDGQIGTPPFDLDMKFVEKRVVWANIIRGHSYIWKPGEGWQRLLVDGSRPAYEAVSYAALFNV